MAAGSRLFAGLVANTRTSTKIVVSLAAILSLTGLVGVTGQYFIDLLQQRMDRTAATTDAMAGIQRIVSEVERFAGSDDPAAAARIQEQIASQVVQLHHLGDDVASSWERGEIDAAATSLTALEAQVARAASIQQDLAAGADVLRQSATAIETASLAVSDSAVRLSGDANRDEQAARDLLKAGNRLAQAAAEIETAARTLAARFSGGVDPAADSSVFDGIGADLLKAVRNAGTTVSGPAGYQLKAVEGLIQDLGRDKNAALAGEANARRSLSATATLLAGRASVLRNTAVAGFAAGIEALGAVETGAVATRSIGEAAGKLNAGARKLMLDAVVFVGTPSRQTADSAKAQIEQVRQILDLLSRDGSSVPEIAAATGSVAALPDALASQIEDVLARSQAADAAAGEMRQSLASAGASLTNLVTLERAAAEADTSSAAFWIVIAVLSAVVASLAIGTLLVFVIQRPIRSLTAGMKRLAGGELDADFIGADRRDEIGDMTRAVLVFRDNAVERQRLEADAEVERRDRAERQARVDGLVRGFEATIGRLLQSVSQNGTTLQHTADRLNGIAGTTASKAESAASASTQASANVQTVASAAEELSASIAAISGQVAQTKAVVEGARMRAQNTNGQIASLSEAATRIGNVVKLISSIAEQTNLLALNATIEAARAGEAGRGFSVVAGEVKNLATQTAKATEDIARQITEIQDSTADAVGAIQGIVETMAEVDRNTAEIAAAVQQQGSATQEISGSVAHAAQGTTLVVDDMRGLNAAVGETSQTASAVLAASGDMRATAEELKRQVDTFLTSVAAA